MVDFAEIFSYFSNCSFTAFERYLISELFPVVKQIIEDFVQRHRFVTLQRYDTTYADENTISDYAEKINRIVRVLVSSDQKRELFLNNFEEWERQRKQNIETLRKIAEGMKDDRMVSNIVKIAAGGIGIGGGLAIIGSLLFPPAAPALLPGWLGGAAVSALLPSIFLPAAPAISSLAVVGGVAAAGGAVGQAGASITELVLTQKSLDESKKLIKEDREQLKNLGLFEFLDELNVAIDNLFGKNSSRKILNDINDFLEKIPPILDDMQGIMRELHTCLNLILPGTTKFLLIGSLLASVIFSILFVVFMVRRQGCFILKHRLALGLVSAVDAGVEITRLIAAAGLKGSKLGELIPRQLAGKIAVGAFAGVGIALDVATMVISSIDLADGSLSDEISMISEVANKLEIHLKSYQKVNEELRRCAPRRLNMNDVTDWTAVVANHIPPYANCNDITTAFNQYLPNEVRDCIILEKLPTDGNHWLVKVPTSHAQRLLRLSHIIIKGKNCLVMK